MQPTERQRKPFEQLLGEILGEDLPLSHRDLVALSNLYAQDLNTFRLRWGHASTARRRKVAATLVRLAEDNTQLNYRDVLLCCLDDPDGQVREAAIEGLTDDDSSTLLERLLNLAAGDPSTRVRSQATLALSRFAYLIETTDLLASYREPLLRLLLELYASPQSSLEVRRRALEAVSYLSGAVEVEEAIAQAYGSTERSMRVSAIHAMGHHMANRWRPVIERELGNADSEMRYEAAHASGEMGDPSLVPQLAPLIQDPDPEVAREAIWALGEIGGTEARRLLEACLRRPEAHIREAAEEALHTLLFFEDPLNPL